MKKVILLSISLLLTACYSMQEREVVVKKRAAYDFGCDEKEIKITHLQTDRIWGIENSVKFGAEGCGQKRVYDNIDDKVYAEGAAPNPVIINQPAVVKQPGTTFKPYGSR